MINEKPSLSTDVGKGRLFSVLWMLASSEPMMKE
jgi:hypothetical protein